ncbi:hypothetical protein BJ741DRAFT_651927 [Chytriomyces cf. hyalinus JEL632]|nr:hypothetical protein BJ741DRAFT_651927 [Chytriomyces cf. hyalinus JEL632]
MQLLSILIIAAAPVFSNQVYQQGQVQILNNGGNVEQVRNNQQYGSQQQGQGQVFRNSQQNQVYQQQQNQVYQQQEVQVPVSWSNQGLRWGQNVIVSNQILGSWGRQWGLGNQQVGQIVSQMVSLPVRSNILVGCRQICQVQRVPMVAIVQIARSCRSHIINQKRVRVIPRHHMLIINSAANVFIQQQRVVRRQQVVIVQRPPVRVQVTRIVIVQKVVQRVQVVTRRLRISESSMGWLMPYIMGNMVNWGCCGVESIDGFNGAISYKRDGDTGMMDMAVKMANDADMQDGMATVLEMLSDKAEMLGSATTAESQQMIADAAKQMKMSEMAITNICAATASAMLTSNMTSGKELDAMVNCATAKEDAFIPMDQISKLSTAAEPKEAQDATGTVSASSSSSSTSVATLAPSSTTSAQTAQTSASTSAVAASTAATVMATSATASQSMTSVIVAPVYSSTAPMLPGKLQASGASNVAVSIAIALFSVLAF